MPNRSRRAPSQHAPSPTTDETQKAAKTPKAQKPQKTPQQTTRRSALTGLLAGGTGLAAAACGGAGAGDDGAPAVQTRKRVRWNLASSFPASLDTIFGAADVFANRLEELTDGRFEVRVNQAGELVPGLQVLDAVQQGSVQCGHTASYYYTGKHPALAFDTAVPFGLTSRQQNAWLLEGGGMALIREVLADFDILNFPSGNTGVQMGGWFRREVPDLESLRGLKMRIPGLGAQVLSEMGVTVQTLAGGEIYTALERGVVDAAEWVGPYDDEKLGFHEIAKYYYYPGWWEPGPNLSLYVNRRAWERLASEDQAAVAAAAAEANVTMQARYDALNPPALQRLIDKGVELRPFTDDVMRSAHDTAFELMNQLAAGDPSYRKVFEGWQKFRTDSQNWFARAELSMASFRAG